MTSSRLFFGQRTYQVHDVLGGRDPTYQDVLWAAIFGADVGKNHWSIVSLQHQIEYWPYMQRRRTWFAKTWWSFDMGSFSSWFALLPVVWFWFIPCCSKMYCTQGCTHSSTRCTLLMRQVSSTFGTSPCYPVSVVSYMWWSSMCSRCWYHIQHHEGWLSASP